MCWHVFFEIIPSCKGRDALVATEGFFPWMSEQVLLEITCRCAGIVALFATIRLFSWVDSHVAPKSRSYSAWVFALWTSKRLLSSVNKHVGSKMASLFARVVALWTNKRPLSAPHVGFKVGRSVRWVAALVAFVIFVCMTVKQASHLEIFLSFARGLGANAFGWLTIFFGNIFAIIIFTLDFHNDQDNDRENGWQWWHRSREKTNNKEVGQVEKVRLLGLVAAYFY